MNKLQTVVSALYTEDDDPENPDTMENLKKSIDLIAKLPMAAAYAYLAYYAPNAKYVTPTACACVSHAETLRQATGKDPMCLDKQWKLKIILLNINRVVRMSINLE